MTGARWVDGLFAVLFALVALYCAVRLVADRRGPNGTPHPGDGAHLAMSLGMIAMFVPSVDPLPRLAWITVFGVIAAWLGAALLRAGAAGAHLPDRGHRVHLVISTAAMVYMFATMSTGGAEPVTAIALPASGGLAHEHAAGGPNLFPVTLALAAYFLLHAAWSGTRLLRVRAGAAEVNVAGSRVADACQVVMGLGMGYMFLVMLG